MVLKNPSNKYEIRLQVKDSIIKQWIIPGVTANIPYLLFSPDTMKLVKSQIGFSQIWIVYQYDYTIVPQNNIIEFGNEFYGNWKEYQSCLVSTMGTEQIILKRDYDDSILIPLEREDFKFELISGKIFTSGHSEHMPIYIGTPPQIQFLISDISEFKRLQLTISPIGNSTLKDKKKYLINDFVSFTSEEQTINLSEERLLGKKPIGRFRIHIRGRLGKDKRFNICCIPSIEAQFDRDMYYPSLEGLQPANVILTVIPKSIVSITDHSAESSEELSENGSIRLSSSERLIQCIIKSPLSNGQFCFIPTTIQIPRVYWSLRGIGEERKFLNITQVKEISKEEWDEAQELYLIVTFLNCKYEEVMLKLISTEHNPILKLNNGKVRFPLHSFSDSLRNTGRTVNEFFLIMGDTPPVEIPVIRIRYEWEIENFNSEDKLVNGSRQLSLYWIDKGQPKNRIVRLNNLKFPLQKCISKPIHNGKSNIVIKEDTALFLPGTYKIEFTIEDPWGHVESIPVNRIHELDIGVGERLPLEKIEEQLLIKSLLAQDGHTHYINLHEYRISINNYIKAEGNEHIYQGHIYTRRFKKGTLKTINDVNPINISFNQSNFTISNMLDKGGNVDEGGDGVYYCCICTKLFWSNIEYQKELAKDHEEFLITDAKYNTIIISNDF